MNKVKHYKKLIIYILIGLIQLVLLGCKSKSNENLNGVYSFTTQGYETQVSLVDNEYEGIQKFKNEHSTVTLIYDNRELTKIHIVFHTKGELLTATYIKNENYPYKTTLYIPSTRTATTVVYDEYISIRVGSNVTHIPKDNVLFLTKDIQEVYMRALGIRNNLDKSFYNETLNHLISEYRRGNYTKIEGGSK